MKRLPLVLTGVLLILWLLLNNTLAPAQWLLGAALAVVFVAAAAQMRPVRPRLKRLHRAPALIWVVLIDIVRSNFEVARIVLGLVRDREVRSGFIEVPLQIRDPHGLAILSAIITSTPGTAWADLSPDGATLTVHVLDLAGEADWIGLIKERYERPLMSIFE